MLHRPLSSFMLTVLLCSTCLFPFASSQSVDSSTSTSISPSPYVSHGSHYGYGANVSTGALVGIVCGIVGFGVILGVAYLGVASAWARRRRAQQAMMSGGVEMQGVRVEGADHQPKPPAPYTMQGQQGGTGEGAGTGAVQSVTAPPEDSATTLDHTYAVNHPEQSINEHPPSYTAPQPQPVM
jgi:hypothetical protein